MSYSNFDKYFKLVYTTTNKRLRKDVYILECDLTVEICHIYRSMTFIFADNVQRIGYDGQAEVRDCNNTYGIRTKISPKDYFRDSLIKNFTPYIKDDIANLYAINKDRDIVLHHGGYMEDYFMQYPPSTECKKLLYEQLNSFCSYHYYVL